MDVQVVKTDATAAGREYDGRPSGARLMEQQLTSLHIIEMPHRWRAMDAIPAPALVRLMLHQQLSFRDPRRFSIVWSGSNAAGDGQLTRIRSWEEGFVPAPMMVESSMRQAERG